MCVTPLGWRRGSLRCEVNGKPVAVSSTPSSYAELRREWRDGDRVEVELPMRTTVERLPDGSDWVAILRGPIVLASPAGTNQFGRFVRQRQPHGPRCLRPAGPAGSRARACWPARANFPGTSNRTPLPAPCISASRISSRPPCPAACRSFPSSVCTASVTRCTGS